MLIFLLCAFRSGTDRYYLKKAKREDVSARELFYYFTPKNSLLLIGFYFNYWFRRLGTLLFCFSPFIVVGTFLYRYFEKNNASVKVATILLFALIVLAANGFYYFIRLNSFFFPARYYFASGKYKSFRSLFDNSYSCIAGKQGDVLRKKLSFVGWFLLSFTVFPAFSIRNYYLEKMAEFALDLIEN